MFSPRAWGWSESTTPLMSARFVLPTCVGMVRGSNLRQLQRFCSPHVRGDGPFARVEISPANGFSPRAWGWSVRTSRTSLPACVLPTCVGMVRTVELATMPETRSPHVRGDGPVKTMLFTIWGQFSPRAWGWSASEGSLTDKNTVLPTCVGMVRVATLSRLPRCSSPHVRGDGPSSIVRQKRTPTFSPRAWGWSGMTAREVRLIPVLPTCVGMVRGLYGGWFLA